MGVPERKLDFVIAWLLKVERPLSHHSEIEEQNASLGSGDLSSGEGSLKDSKLISFHHPRCRQRAVTF